MMEDKRLRKYAISGGSATVRRSSDDIFRTVSAVSRRRNPTTFCCCCFCSRCSLMACPAWCGSSRRRGVAWCLTCCPCGGGWGKKVGAEDPSAGSHGNVDKARSSDRYDSVNWWSLDVHDLGFEPRLIRTLVTVTPLLHWLSTTQTRLTSQRRLSCKRIKNTNKNGMNTT